MSQKKRNLSARSPSKSQVQLNKRQNYQSSATEYESFTDSSSSEEGLLSLAEHRPTDVNKQSTPQHLMKMSEIKDFAVLLRNAILDPATAEAFRTVLKPVVEEQTDKIMTKITTLERTTEKHSTELDILEQRIDTLEQGNRLNNIRISGINPPEKGTLANINAARDLFSEKLGVKLSVEDIDDAYMVGKSPATTMIVKFPSAALKSQVISKRTSLKGSSPAIYLNDDLTRTRADIYKHTRGMVKDKKIYATWTSNCKIYVKMRQDSLPRIINKRLIPSPTNT